MSARLAARERHLHVIHLGADDVHERARFDVYGDPCARAPEVGIGGSREREREGAGAPCSLTSSSNRFFSLAYSIVYDSPLHPRDCEQAWGG